MGVEVSSCDVGVEVSSCDVGVEVSVEVSHCLVSWTVGV